MRTRGHHHHATQATQGEGQEGQEGQADPSTRRETGPDDNHRHPLRVAWGVLVLCSLAGYRLARLVAVDDIGAPLRAATVRRWPGSATRPSAAVIAVHCEWCLTVWTTAGAVAFARATGILTWSWPLLALGWLAAAAVAGLLGRFSA